MSVLEEGVLRAAGVSPSPDEVMISAEGLHYRQLNKYIRRCVLSGARVITVFDVFGQRYIGTNLGGVPERRCRILIHGTPGNDLGAFMDGPTIEVYGNAQDGVGNTMNSGEIIIHGHAGDVLGMSMRGGRIFVRDDVGARCAVHMKEYGEKLPLIVIGGTARDFLGEYMAGGILIVLGRNLNPGTPHPARFIGTGMHGGRIFLRGTAHPAQLGEGVAMAECSEDDKSLIREAVRKFSIHFSLDPEEILTSRFVKLYPRSHRPYGAIYGGPSRACAR